MTDRAVFLDRDGVINHDDDYIYEPEKFRLIEGVFVACARLAEAGYKLVIITNQAGIARGYYNEDDFHQLMAWLLEQFRLNGVGIDAYYFCPHHPEKGIGAYRVRCDCRKPRPGMLLQAAAELDIDLSQSILVGDKICDIEAGRNAGLKACYLVRSGKPLSQEDINAADGVFDNLLAFSASI